jgi:hypothetical protein
MPITETDVLAVLSEAVSANLDFWVGPVHVSSRAYGVIGNFIRAGNILVISGTQSLAFYHDDTDILETQAGNPPLDLGQRAQLLHECTHALIDAFNGRTKVTRHQDEVISYIAQIAFSIRANPSYTTGPNNPLWYTFFKSVEDFVRNNGLDKLSGNGARIDLLALEGLRIQLTALPYVNYGSFRFDEPSGANGLANNNFFLDLPGEAPSSRGVYSTRASYPEPSDDYLIGRLQEQYAASDVVGYGSRLRALRRDFALCSLPRARALFDRLQVVRPGDRLSTLFYERLSRRGCAVLVQVLRQHISPAT